MKNCNLTLNNTGTGCTPLLQVLKKLILVPIFDNTGAKNRIDLSATLNQAYFDALVNEPEPTKRWYPLPFMKDADANRAENITENFKDGSKIFIQQGAKSFTAVIIEKDAPARLLKKMNPFRTIEFGVYGIDKDNNLIGMLNVAGFLDPIRVDASSWAPRFVEATDTTSQKIMLQFEWHINEKDENLDMVTPAELVAGTDIVNLDGLLDVSLEFSNTATTGFRVELDTDYGTQLNPIRDEGRVAADFISTVTAATSKVRNTTTNADVSITSVTETSTKGIYDVVYAAQSSGDVIEVTLTKAGRSYTKNSFATP